MADGTPDDPPGQRVRDTWTMHSMGMAASDLENLSASHSAWEAQALPPGAIEPPRWLELPRAGQILLGRLTAELRRLTWNARPRLRAREQPVPEPLNPQGG